jgi:serine/threonine protein kinase
MLIELTLWLLSGGYGEVKRAVSLETGETVAIKIIDKSIVDNPVQVKRQNALLTLRHP